MIDGDAGNASEMLNDIALEAAVFLHLHVHHTEPPLAPDERDSPHGAVGIPGSVDIQGECTVNDVLIHFKVARTLDPEEMQRSARDFEADGPLEGLSML